MSDGRRITLRGAAVAEIEEKRSVFIAYAAPVRNEDEAHAIIEEKKKEYADATHNVWAYYIAAPTTESRRARRACPLSMF